MPQRPPKQSPKGPPKVIQDRADLQEVLADGLIGAAYMEGLILLTFSIERVVPGAEGQDAPRYRAVVSRLALTKKAFSDLAGVIPRLTGAIDLVEQQPATGQQPN